MDTILIRYAEIALKGANRHIFEDQLIKNIKLSQKSPLQIIKLQKQILITGEKIDLDKLKQVFGIAWLAPVIITPNDLPSIAKVALKLTLPKLTFAVRAHHGLEVTLGDIVRLKKKIKVDLSHPQQTIYISIIDHQVLIYNQKFPVLVAYRSVPAARFYVYSPAVLIPLPPPICWPSGERRSIFSTFMFFQTPIKS